MRDVVELLNAMVGAGLIIRYAVFGAVAQMRYTEAVVTFDADVLVGLPERRGLDLLGPLYDFCRARGFSPEGEAVRVGAWPVQLIPTFSSLTEEALAAAEQVELDGAEVWVVSAAHLAVIALSVGRAKDLARVAALREAGAATDEAIAAVAGRHGLAPAWERFKERFDGP